MKGKRKIACIADSDSDYENDENESDNSQDEIKPVKNQSTGGKVMAKKKIKLETKGAAKSSFEEKLKANVAESCALLDVNENENADIIDVPVVYRHQKYDWLKPENIRDAKKRRPDHPEYDPTTLYVPESHLNDLTPVRIAWFLLLSFCTVFSFLVTIQSKQWLSFTGNASMVGY